MAGPAKLRVDIVADASGVDKGIDKADSKFSKLGGKLGKIAGPAGLALGAIGAAAGAMAIASVKAASDLEQNMGAVSTVFGKASKVVEGYAATAATKVGLSKAEYAGLAASVGTSMQNMGKSQGEAAKATDQIISRAADLASTFGGTATEATQALGAAFRGEFDSVERLGISLRASDISAELAARGQSKLTGQALKNAQGQATLDLIMKQTTKSQGAFGRESNTLAGQQARLKAQFDNVKAAIGARLIPVLVKAGQWVQSNLFPAFERLRPSLSRVGSAGGEVARIYSTYLFPIIRGLIGGLTTMKNSVTGNASSFAKLKPILTGLMAVAKFLAPIVGTILGGAFRLAGEAIGFVIGLIARLIDGVDWTIRKFDDLWRKVEDVAGWIKDKIGGLGDTLGKIPGFSVELNGVMRPALTGGVGGLGFVPDMLGPGGLMTAASDPWAWLDSFGSVAGRSSSRSAAAGVTVNMPVTVTGALDPVAVARQVERIVKDNALRVGKAVLYA